MIAVRTCPSAHRLSRAAACALCILTAFLLVACEADTSKAEAPETDQPRSATTDDGVELTVTASAREIEVGQLLTVDYQVIAGAGVQVTWPEFGEKLGPFEVRESESTPPIPLEGGAKKEWKTTLELMTFEEGSLEVPPIEVTCATGDDAAEKTIASNPLTIVSHSVVGEEADPGAYRDIKGVADMPTSPRWMLWAMIAGGALLLLGGAGVIIFFAIRAGSQPVTEPPLSPHEWALLELTSLERSRLIEERAFEPFYVRLSAVVRGYVERRFGLMAPERTTDEFLREAQGSRLLRDDHRELLATFLRAADMVKFARYEPMEVDCKDALASARQFVVQTVPATPAEQAEAAA